MSGRYSRMSQRSSMSRASLPSWLRAMTKPAPQFDGQISIVTGAGSGTSLATAEGLAAGGATVVCVDWKGAEEAAASIWATGGIATGASLDVRGSAGWTALKCVPKTKE
jgi:NADP-dependent 3-hydroxy acid dehydrogenase YdfG